MLSRACQIKQPWLLSNRSSRTLGLIANFSNNVVRETKFAYRKSRVQAYIHPLIIKWSFAYCPKELKEIEALAIQRTESMLKWTDSTFMKQYETINLSNREMESADKAGDIFLQNSQHFGSPDFLRAALAQMYIMSPYKLEWWKNADLIISSHVGTMSPDTLLMAAKFLHLGNGRIRKSEHQFQSLDLIYKKLAQLTKVETIDGSKMLLLSNLSTNRQNEVDMYRNLEKLALLVDTTRHIREFYGTSIPNSVTDFLDSVYNSTLLTLKAYDDSKFTSQVVTAVALLNACQLTGDPYQYAVYQKLYSLIDRSAEKNSKQVSQFYVFYSIMSCMVNTRVRSNALMETVIHHMEKNKYYPLNFGLKAFQWALELNFSPKILKYSEKLVVDSFDRDDHVIPRAQFVELSQDARSHLFRTFRNLERDIQISDVIVATMAFGQEEESSKRFATMLGCYKQFLPNIPKVKPNMAIELLRTMAMCNLNHGVVVSKIQEHVDRNLDSVSGKAVSSYLYASAKLNSPPKEIDRVIKTCISELRNESNTVNPTRNFTSALTMWSICVLDKFVRENVRDFLPAMVFNEDPNDASAWNDSIQSMHYQILIEWKILQRMYPNLFSSEEMAAIDAVWATARTSNVYRQRMIPPRPSQLHMTASEILGELGLMHENEVLVDDAYSADIFIPIDQIANFNSNRADEATLAKSFNEMSRMINPNGKWDLSSPSDDDKPKTTQIRGVLVEMDGPSHFDKYLKLPLGQTVLKRRQLESLGYLVVTIPYWKFDISQSTERKRALMYEVMLAAQHYVKNARPKHTIVNLSIPEQQS